MEETSKTVYGRCNCRDCGQLSKLGGSVRKNTGVTGMEGKMMSSKTMEKQWQKLWLRCETIRWKSNGKIEGL